MHHHTVTPATLHLLCGKIASGKSTLAARLGAEPGCIILSEDQWLAALYPDQLHSVADYVRCAALLKNAFTPHLLALLTAGVSVVLDFPANTQANRGWMMSLITRSAAQHQLHYLDLPDDCCKARLHARNQSGEHLFAATEQQFDLITRYFEPPQASEGFNLVYHR